VMQGEIPLMVKIPRWNLPRDLGDFEIQDLYKHLHHAYMGPAHAILSRDAAASALAAEWSELGPAEPDEEVLEPLTWTGSFVRVHLRPYRDRGGAQEALLEAFLLSAEAPRDSAAFVAAWEEAGVAVAEGRLPFLLAAFDSLDSVVRARGWPAVHHSERYLKRYRPAYRVLDRQRAEGLLDELQAGGRRP
jgi:hypothetical protein